MSTLSLVLDLEGQFYRLAPERPDVHIPVDSITDAQGVMFLCPACFRANGGPVGTHSILCWFNGHCVPADKLPGPGRWNPVGTGLGDLTFVGPGQTSVSLPDGCKWHGFIENGRARDA